MKNTLLLVFITVICIPSFAQVGINSQWTWVSGNNSRNNFGVYGIKGVPAPGNLPGARSGSSSWKDASGNFWIFGGTGKAATTTGQLNDLWKYDPLTNLWAWVSGDSVKNLNGVYGTKGFAGALNKPGAREYGFTWADNSGNLWMFGGGGFAATGTSIGELNDMWKYNITSNQWMWVHGDNTINNVSNYGTKGVGASSNKPGGRQWSISWTDDSGNFWLFGGDGTFSGGDGSFNDVWKYNPSTNQWTWITGDNTVNNSGVYGTQGITTGANKPGARYYSVSWKDLSGNFWLFGGFGYDKNGTEGFLNDLWKYDLTANQWTWMKGDNTVNNFGVHGTQGVPDNTIKPGAGVSGGVWTDALGNLWLFGGAIYTAPVFNYGESNDLWKYNLLNNQWTWMKGDNAINVAGSYGTQGIPSPSNKPGGREEMVTWFDNTGNLWLFGGGNFTGTNGGSNNDLWKINSNALVLPISLANLTAEASPQSIRINWQTLQEFNTDHFIIERSGDGINFSSIGTVQSAGTSFSAKDYSFIDHQPLTGNNYYRLKITDLDGKVSYSKIVIAKTNGLFSLAVYPNPIKAILVAHINGINELATIQIISTVGEKLKEERVVLNGNTSISIAVKDLPQGSYYLLLKTTSETFQQRFIKN